MIPRPSAKTEPEITDDSTWTEGDLTLISSDHVRFKVQSYHVFSASRVFADATSLGCTSQLVHLTDDTIETAAVVGAFLQLTTTWDSMDLTELEDLHRLALFLNKYDCPGPLKVIIRILFSRLSAEECDRETRLRLFLIACDLDCAELAAGTLHSNDTSYLNYIFANISRSELQNLPERYRWALFRARAVNVRETLKHAKANKPARRPVEAFNEALKIG